MIDEPEPTKEFLTRLESDFLKAATDQKDFSSFWISVLGNNRFLFTIIALLIFGLVGIPASFIFQEITNSTVFSPIEASVAHANVLPVIRTKEFLSMNAEANTPQPNMHQQLKLHTIPFSENNQKAYSAETTIKISQEDEVLCPEALFFEDFISEINVTENYIPERDDPYTYQIIVKEGNDPVFYYYYQNSKLHFQPHGKAQEVLEEDSGPISYSSEYREALFADNSMSEWTSTISCNGHPKDVKFKFSQNNFENTSVFSASLSGKTLYQITTATTFK